MGLLNLEIKGQRICREVAQAPETEICHVGRRFGSTDAEIGGSKQRRRGRKHHGIVVRGFDHETLETLDHGHLDRAVLVESEHDFDRVREMPHLLGPLRGEQRFQGLHCTTQLFEVSPRFLDTTFLRL